MKKIVKMLLALAHRRLYREEQDVLHHVRLTVLHEGRCLVDVTLDQARVIAASDGSRTFVFNWNLPDRQSDTVWFRRHEVRVYFAESLSR